MMYKLLIANILTTMIAVIQAEDPEPDWQPIEWTHKNWDNDPSFTTPTRVDFTNESILLKTGTDGGVDKSLLVSFNFKEGPAGIIIRLDQDNPNYFIQDCSLWPPYAIDFPAAIPAPDQNGYRIFRIEEYRFYGFQISCNDEVILSFLPSTMECGDYQWAKWLQRKRGINFKVQDGKPAFKKYAVVPREDKADQTTEEDAMDNEYDIDMEWSWTPLFTYKGPIPVDLDMTDVLLKIGKRGIGRKQLRMDFLDAEGNKAGGFRLTMFEKNPMYEFINCTSSEYVVAAQTNLPELPEPDENGDRIFKIERYGYYGLQVSCNGHIILNFQPSLKRCPTYKSYLSRETRWDVESWIRDVKKITFDFIYFSGAESYYALVPRGIDITTDSPVNSTSKEESNEKTASDDILSCFQCEEIILTDKEGNKMEIPADLKAAVNPRPCKRSNKRCPGEEFDACLDYVVTANLTGRDRLTIIQKDCVIREPLEHDSKYIRADAYDKICKLGIKAELKHILGVAHYYVSCSWENICSEDSCNNNTAYLELDMASHAATMYVITAAVAMLVLNF